MGGGEGMGFGGVVVLVLMLLDLVITNCCLQCGRTHLVTKVQPERCRPTQSWWWRRERRDEILTVFGRGVAYNSIWYRELGAIGTITLKSNETTISLTLTLTLTFTAFTRSRNAAPSLAWFAMPPQFCYGLLDAVTCSDECKATLEHP